MSGLPAVVSIQGILQVSISFNAILPKRSETILAECFPSNKGSSC
jgi:hypothetical protein